MKNREAWSNCETYSKGLTDFSRKLAFASAAICWYFHDSNYSFPPRINVALFLLMVYFVGDVLQYFVAFHKWRQWILSEESAIQEKGERLEDAEFDIPANLDKWPFRLFLTKIFILLFSFIFIASEFASRS